jgi:hypothetical protein
VQWFTGTPCTLSKLPSAFRSPQTKNRVLYAETLGATFRPSLHTLIDRAIESDSTALMTGRSSLPQPDTRAYEDV